MATLIIIPARKGSKGIPGKNIKKIGDTPLVAFSIEYAKKIAKEKDVICVTTNDEKVVAIAKQNGVEPPFIRPEELANDTATSYDVIMHALSFYENLGYSFSNVLLLQPTSPFRIVSDYVLMLNEYTDEIDMVVTVKVSKDNPYYNLFEEDRSGFLFLSKKTENFERRQDSPLVYAYNGSMYLINVSSLKKERIRDFSKIRKILQPEERSVDIDTYPDWILAEYFFEAFKQALTNEEF